MNHEFKPYTDNPELCQAERPDSGDTCNAHRWLHEAPTHTVRASTYTREYGVVTVIRTTRHHYPFAVVHCASDGTASASFHRTREAAERRARRAGRGTVVVTSDHTEEGTS